MVQVVKVVCPLAYASLERHMPNGVHVSGDEKAAIQKMVAGELNPLEGRRREEFERKLSK